MIAPGRVEAVGKACKNISHIPSPLILLMTLRLLQSPRLSSRWAAVVVCGSGRGKGGKVKVKEVRIYG